MAGQKLKNYTANERKNSLYRDLKVGMGALIDRKTKFFRIFAET
jgi:hypothetical protein